MSKLLKSLEDRIAIEDSEYVRAELRAKRAAYLARIGDFDEARKEIASIRETFGDGRSGRVTVLVMIAEGLVLHFESLSGLAIDRVMRALMLAQAGRDQELIALTSAWKAYFDFERSDFETAARSLALAESTAEKSDSAAGLRICAVLFTGFALCGRVSIAQKYFLKGREHALREGDQAGLDALLHNKAVFTAAHMRAAYCIGQLDKTALPLVRTDVNSARNLQQLTRIQSLASYIELADARLAILEERYEYALTKLEQLQGRGPFPPGHFGANLGLIEQSHCLCQLGRLDEAEFRSRDARDLALEGIDSDDQLVATWQLLAMSRLDPRFGVVQQRELAFEEAKLGYHKMTVRLDQAFAPFAKA